MFSVAGGSDRRAQGQGHGGRQEASVAGRRVSRCSGGHFNWWVLFPCLPLYFLLENKVPQKKKKNFPLECNQTDQLAIHEVLQLNYKQFIITNNISIGNNNLEVLQSVLCQFD